MIDGAWTALLLLTIALGAIVAYWRWRTPSRITERSTALAQRASGGAVEVIRPAADVLPVPNPLGGLTFRDSLEPQRFGDACSSWALARTNRSLALSAGDGIVVAVQAMTMVHGRAELVVRASREGAAMLRDGSAVIARYRKTGQLIPQLVDAKTGKVIEHMKEVAADRITAQLASISTMAVACCHMVSAADLARRMSRVESKVDLLLELRQVDQQARLERIFEEAREILGHSIDAPAADSLRRLRADLHELRATWAREVEAELRRIEPLPERGWIWQRLTPDVVDRHLRRRERQARTNPVSAVAPKVALMEYSLRLELCLAVAGDRLPEFQERLIGERETLTRLANLLTTKVGMLAPAARMTGDPAALGALATALRGQAELDGEEWEGEGGVGRLD